MFPHRSLKCIIESCNAFEFGGCVFLKNSLNCVEIKRKLQACTLVDFLSLRDRGAALVVNDGKDIVVHIDAINFSTEHYATDFYRFFHSEVGVRIFPRTCRGAECHLKKRRRGLEHSFSLDGKKLLKYALPVAGAEDKLLLDVPEGV